MSCAVMQEWRKLGAEYVASKHYAKSVYYVHRLATVHRLSVVSAYTVQMLYVVSSVWHCMLLVTYDNLVSTKLPMQIKVKELMGNFVLCTCK